MSEFSNYTIHNSSGEILRAGSCATDQLGLQAGAGETLTVGYSTPETHTVINPATSPTIVERALSSITLNKSSFTANGSDSVTFSNIPSGSAVTISMPDNTGLEDIYQAISDSWLTITTTLAGTYTVAITNPARIAMEVNIYAN